MLSLDNKGVSKIAVSLSGICDADWASDLDDRRSMTGYFFYLDDGGAISWQTHKQSSVVTSSTQEDYQALSMATKEAIWLRELLKDLRFTQGSTTIWQDNQSTIALAKNPIHHARTKHIDIQHHYIRECIENEAICLLYISTEQMVADLLTKALPKTKFDFCVQGMGITTSDKQIMVKRWVEWVLRQIFVMGTYNIAQDFHFSLLLLPIFMLISGEFRPF